MPLRRTTAALLALGGLTACAEPPSYSLRWTIEGRVDAPDAAIEPTVSSVASCSDTGLFQIVARTYALPDPEAAEPNFATDLRDERIYPCHPEAFDDDAAVGGALLPPGEYVIQLRGADRADEVWSDSDPSLNAENPAEFGSCGSEGDLDCGPAAPFCKFGRCRDGTEGDPCSSNDECLAALRCNAAEVCEYVTGCAPEAGYADCLDDERVCDCARLTVTEDSGTTVLDFVLDPPGECEDGIDNDLDGRVDDSDPSCLIASGDGTEGLPVGITEVRLGVSLLGQTPLESCLSSIRGIEMTVQTEGTTSEMSETSEMVELLEETCQLDRAYSTSVLLPAGPATFSVRGLVALCDEEACGEDPDCSTSVAPQCYPEHCASHHEACDTLDLTQDLCIVGGRSVPLPEECRDPADQPATVVKTFTAEIRPTGGSINETIDFSAGDFLAPIEARMLFGFDYRINYGTERGETAVDRIPVSARNTCEPLLDGGQLRIADLQLTMTNGHDAPLGQPVRLTDGTPLDGSALVPCFGGTLETAVVDWAEGYTLTAEALSAEGEVCFRREGIPMRPEETIIIELPRDYDADGNVPDSCRDCATTGDCNAENFGEAICIPEGLASAGTCQYPCYEQSDCRSEGLDDTSLTCVFEPDDQGEPLDFGYCRYVSE